MADDTPLGELRQQRERLNGLMEDVPQLVRAARMTGATWEEIGAALGMTRQSAHKAYARNLAYDFPLNSDT
jgi:hypothetical protein